MILVIAGLFLQSCSNDPAPTIKAGETGFFIVNEGLFGNGNASLSFYDRKTDAVTNNTFSIQNGRPLGDQAQSMTVFENKGYIVVQNSAKVEVINAVDYSSIGTISADLPNPRYFIGVSSVKGYVSDWGADGLTGTIKVIDLTTYKVTKSIPTGKGPNRMLKVNNLVYVTNSGGYGNDNTVKVIDTGTDAVSATITVGDNPNSIQRDKDGNIWVASSGIVVYSSYPTIDNALSTKGTLSKINASNAESVRLTLNVVSSTTINSLGISPDGSTLYYSFDDKVFSMPVTATTLPTIPFKASSYYGLAVDPFNGNIIGCQVPSFSAAGSIDVIDPSGNLLKNFTVGIAPNGCAFK
jgi:YVTN family beta-propeller protein